MREITREELIREYGDAGKAIVNYKDALEKEDLLWCFKRRR